MKIVEQVKTKLMKLLKVEKKNDKIDVIFDYLIDTIEVKEDMVYIKTKKNIILENDGSIININKGYSVNISEKIHLNPIINFKKEDINNIKQICDDAEKKALEEAYTKLREQGII